MYFKTAGFTFYLQVSSHHRSSTDPHLGNISRRDGSSLVGGYTAALQLIIILE